MSLVFSNISKTYSNNKTATLKDINLEIGKGEFVCIVGKSGCGKSTLLNLAAGLEQPSSGRISLDDREVTKPGADRTVMFQEHGLFPWLTVQENVEFGMKLAKIPLAQRREKAEYYLKHDDERCQIAHNGHELVKKYHSYENRLEQIFNISL